MTIRDTVIAKLQQLPDPLMEEVSNFIDFIIDKHQAKPDDSQPAETLVEAWTQWFEAVDSLDITIAQPLSNYQQLLLNKYRQQGLEL